MHRPVISNLGSTSGYNSLIFMPIKAARGTTNILISKKGCREIIIKRLGGRKLWSSGRALSS